ncbi:MAG: argininosuccinate synthase [Alistipes sp.]|nr:argininosuccinate synthase [Alistipes sp.]
MASVLLGFSGGIDSTTAAQKLKDEGYNVVALTIDTMLNDDAIERAKLRAAEVGVEWYLYDARERFERDIIEYFCEEYASGRTPAPCTRCNTLIKWQILLEEANRLGIEHIATGHYFNIEQHGGYYYVAQGADATKDQSYYLWGLSQEILQRALTPMGMLIKRDVKANFKDKSESMGICFLEGKPYAEFLQKRGVAMVPGEVVNSRGEVCGYHNGIARYTIGQKRGEGLMDGMRVVDIDASKNHIIVGEGALLYKHKLYITNYNIVNISELLSADDITIKIRGIGVNPQRPVHITQRGEELIAETPDAAFAPAKGQPLVFYRNNLVIGGGIVVDFE